MKQDRVYGLDYLRILCMVFIVTLHYLGVGGAFYNLDQDIGAGFTVNYVFASILEAFSVIAVNCFIMISGYLLSASTFKKSKFINYVLMVLFYSYVISAICFIYNPELINFKNIIYTILPISLSKYWFMTTYLALYLLFPYINKMCGQLSRIEFKRLLILLVIIFSVWQTLIPFAETLDNTKGYGIIWFILLYLFGAYIRKFGIKKRSASFYLTGYVIFCITICFMKLLCNIISTQIPFIAKAQNLFYHYNSVIALLAAICLFRFFLSLKINKIPKIILSMSSLSLGVYLIHDHFLLRDILWGNIIHVNKIFNNMLFPIISILCILLVYIICTFIEYMRVSIFDLIRKEISDGHIQKDV